MLNLLYKACRDHKSLLTFTLTTTLLLKILVLAPPLLFGGIIDALGTNPKGYQILLPSLIAAFILAGCVHAAINPAQNLLLSKLVQSIIRDASIHWVTQLIRKEFDAFNTWRIGHFIKSVERGLTAHEKLLTFFITTGLPILLEFIVVGGAFLYMGGLTIFLALNGCALVYAFATYKIILWRRLHLTTVNEQEDELSAVLFNTLSAGKTIKLEGAEESASRPLNLAFKRYADAAITVASSSGYLSGAKILFISFSTGALLAWGVFNQLSATPSISVGQLVAIFSIASSYLLNVTNLTEGYRVLDQFLADQRRLEHLLTLPNFDDETRQAVLPKYSESTLALKPCFVTADGSSRINVNTTLSFTQGQSVAITGPSGAGKSTLLEALAGLNLSLRDNLYINGVAVSDLNAKAHLDCIRYCPQSPQFLEGAFEHSVLFGVDRSSGLEQAIRQLQVEAVVDHRSLAENATNVSGGEAKRLSLLRLINKPGHFNLFDEPSASIEQTLAVPVWDLLFETFGKLGLICVTHDLRHLERFDRVIIMREGAIVDDGPWHELQVKPAIRKLLDNMPAHE
ncbi:ABC transporter ATP-binding protein [Pseudomonas lurida]|jgi:ATP-binding cassette subfamily B protein/ATP-binding cassette subfamily B protein RtxE|uniref:ABC transporter ATP-binding protein n=1 Tax=Pseudomonas quebecensis TaxID=2995174 RepID=A0ABY6QPE6_9PSED|nr:MULTISPECIES: ABC transporter ATP-binding protein [Pseudomonas]MBA1293301.1 ABC transporter ATP-binding protein [Pseudomonas lurida]MCP1511369.1 ATP-binding cassette subfamily B protein/ATP-binding cassette subfamily B protein RtxE [Pseudomonas rhodesiae]MCX4065861.1 ABC transporter ATP-binding protein [Pseudomonas quebecensis]MDF9770191.1 ATP-binding cassette subfamily B protein/ATP-binding cassette subfamily B protein RtxE [Pseudomonas rhodesiae]UZW20756.1 ABC transporter ATP-binding prot